MNPFDYRPRTRVVFGNGSLDRLGELARELRGSRVLLVSDPGIIEAGHPARAGRALESAGCSWTLFSEVDENPTVEHVEAGLAVAKEFKPDMIVGLGGGSSMDCAKGINFLLTNGGSMRDYWGVGKATRPMLPLIAIPTTAGTGSEAQSFALIADPETHQKMACGDPKAAAAIAILDPELTLSQPARVTALTGIDAVSHALETWVCKKRNAVSTMYSREAWRLLSGSLPRVLSVPSDQQARAGMLLGAHLAGAAIENSMLGIAHSCANPLTAHFGIVHGAAVGMMLPAVMRFNSAAVGSLYGELVPTGPDGVNTLVAAVESLLDQAAIPRRLSGYKVPEAELPRLAQEAAEQWTAQFNPRAVTADDLVEIYRAVL
ncbi:MAG: iron-containing alcohol dehydrogenase [Acidobacteria bacterium]|nr:iron-containing alcohol dehydrogenase [Acidobacteriota bacterium]